MIWLGTSPSEPGIRELLDRKYIGLMCGPYSHSPEGNWIWAGDSGCFSEDWKEHSWWRWARKPHPRPGCLFMVVPDYVGDHDTTLKLWGKWSERVRQLGKPVAFVAQNGASISNIPWDEMDAVFIGGTTAWKMSDEAFGIARHARSIGKWVHVGRVNGIDRVAAWMQDCDSSDGTILAFAPKENLFTVMKSLEFLRRQTMKKMDEMGYDVPDEIDMRRIKVRPI